MTQVSKPMMKKRLQLDINEEEEEKKPQSRMNSPIRKSPTRKRMSLVEPEVEIKTVYRQEKDQEIFTSELEGDFEDNNDKNFAEIQKEYESAKLSQFSLGVLQSLTTNRLKSRT